MSRKSKQPTNDPRAAKYEQVFEKIYRFVLKIPHGRVMTYGQIARLMDDRYSPRLVGWAMHAVPHDERNIPWHRVINSKGGISTGRVIIQEPQLQQYLLEAEGVVFNERGHCDLSVYQWSPVKRKAKDESLKPARKATRQAGGAKSAKTKASRPATAKETKKRSAGRVASKSSAKKAGASKSSGKKSAASKSAMGRVATGKPTTSGAAGKSATSRAAGKSAASRAAGKSAATKSKTQKSKSTK